MYRLKPITARSSIDLLSEFNEQLPIVGTPDEGDPIPIGFWALIHVLMAQNGYDWYDEVEACTRAITNRIRSLSAYESEEEAYKLLSGAIENLEAFADEFGEQVVENDR